MVRWSHYWRRGGPMMLAELTSGWSHVGGGRQATCSGSWWLPVYPEMGNLPLLVHSSWPGPAMRWVPSTLLRERRPKRDVFEVSPRDHRGLTLARHLDRGHHQRGSPPSPGRGPGSPRSTSSLATACLSGTLGLAARSDGGRCQPAAFRCRATSARWTSNALPCSREHGARHHQAFVLGGALPFWPTGCPATTTSATTSTLIQAPSGTSLGRSCTPTPSTLSSCAREGPSTRRPVRPPLRRMPLRGGHCRR
jgi:hypothetical protein